jgi:MoaA/NifB/PqqE/SkfB family radical SAM enzyme
VTIALDRPLPAADTPQRPWRFLWLDLTRKCQLSCDHCYNASSPDGGHGTMTRADWLNVLDQAIRTGVEHIQLIGGEVTMHPDFTAILDHALTVGLKVEVFTNLVHIKPEWWELFQRPGVSLATSYYSDQADQHNAITGRDSHRKTRANIARAAELGIELRTGIIATRPEQRVEAAHDDLTSLGIVNIGTDRLRHFGRGQQDHTANDVNELCGGCGNGRAAIGPDGTVTPCIMSAWMGVGNVREASLTAILTGEAMADAVTAVQTAHTNGTNPCNPDNTCEPDCAPKNPCDPRKSDDGCNPGTPSGDCRPRN